MAKKKAPPAEQEPSPINKSVMFPTFFLVKQWDNSEKLNDALRLEIYRERIRNPAGIYRSNASGTHHTDTKLLQWAGDPAQQLADMWTVMFRALADQWGGQTGGSYEFSMSAWAMIYADRGYATAHTHPNCHMSGVYYVDSKDGENPKTMATGDRVWPGELEFVDTRGCFQLQVPGLVLQPAQRIKPTPGLMVVFPSWVPHFVHPVVGDEERISIACNASIRKYTRPNKEEK